jgi:3-oxoacyl-[acyl-carrier protein] reductase
MNGAVSQRRVLVTGGTRGIGRAVALAFAESGARVHACGQAPGPAADELRGLLAKYGDDHIVDSADLAQPGQGTALTERAVAALGGLDVVVNNAGVVSHRTLDDLDGPEWDRVLNTNLRATYEVCRAAAPHLPSGGAIVNVSSAVAMIGMVARVHYTAAKAGVLGLTKSLCKELGPRGVRVNAVAPGIIETDQTAGLTPAVRERYEQLAALRRLGTPADVADVVLFLAGDQARFVSGQVLVIDGGI